jgi:MFS family permease
MTYEGSTFLYAIAVAIFALGGMVGGFTGGWIANKSGRYDKLIRITHQKSYLAVEYLNCTMILFVYNARLSLCTMPSLIRINKLFLCQVVIR